MKKKIAIVLFVALLFSCMSQIIFASSISPETFYQTKASTVLTNVQKNEYQNKQGQKLIQYQNIDSYVQKSLASKNSEASSLEVAKEIIKEIDGNAVLIDLPEEYILEALTYKETTQTISYVKASSDGTTELVDEGAVIKELEKKLKLKTLNNTSTTPTENETISDDGYMKLVLTATLVERPSYSTDDTERFYLVSAASYWLIEPLYTYEDVLALSFGSAVYDTMYEDFARIYELELCRKCDNFYQFCYDETYPSGGHPSYNDPEGKNHIQIFNPSGAGVACRVNFDKNIGECNHFEEMAGTNVDYSYIDMMFSYVRSRVIATNHFTLFCEYAHKWTGIGSIGVSIAPGAGKGAGAISFSAKTDFTTFRSKALTIYYYN